MEIIDRILDWYPWLQRHRPPVVSVLRLEGVIAQSHGMRKGLNLASQAMAIEKAFNVRKLAAVALCINSPGGSPVQSALIAKRIRDLADEKSTPIIAFAEDVAARAGVSVSTVSLVLNGNANLEFSQHAMSPITINFLLLLSILALFYLHHFCNK